jgi:hypothetical protein
MRVMIRTMLAVAALALAPGLAEAKKRPASDPLAQRIMVMVQQAAKNASEAGDNKPGKRDRDHVTLERIRAQGYEVDTAAGIMAFDARPLGK